MKMFKFITSLLYVNFVFCIEDCLKLDISITQKVENEGFHRSLRWLVEMGSYEAWMKSDCNVSLFMEVNPGMFVNPDEIAELNRAGELSVRIVGEVNVETPAHESTGHLVYFYLPKTSNKLTVSLPIHLRYQRAQITGGYGKVHLRKPSLLGTCKKGPERFCSKNKQIIRAPCDLNGNYTCRWRNITYQPLFEDVELFVPIGDLDDYPLVSIVTLLLGCAGCIYILSILSTAPL